MNKQTLPRTVSKIASIAFFATLFSACSEQTMEAPRFAEVAPDRPGATMAADNAETGSSDGFSGTEDGRVFTVSPGPNATQEMLDAMVQLLPGDVLEFGCGFFELDRGLLLQATEDIVVRGCGMDETILSFRNSANATGVEANFVRGIAIEDLTTLDTPGDGIKFVGVKWGTVRNVRTMWSGGLCREEGTGCIDESNYQERIHVSCTTPPMNEGDPTPDYTPSRASGRYGIFPVNSENVVVEGVESVGASDAGIYTGQMRNSIIRNSRAVYNVFGFEIENVQGAEYDNNLAECNTAAYLIYDLENLGWYGDRTVMRNNVAWNNNTYNFAPPHTLVGRVPRGTGMITLGYDRIEAYNNKFIDHSTAGVLYVSYALIDGPGGTADKRLDQYSEGVHIYNNTFINSGYDPGAPSVGDLLSGDSAKLLPILVAYKNPEQSRKGAHIIWDGLLDEKDDNCPWPVDEAGNPVPANELGRPAMGNQYPNPDCTYNAYKFDEAGNLKMPQWGACVHDNEYSPESTKYMNLNGIRGFELPMALMEGDWGIFKPSRFFDAVGALFDMGASTDMSELDCESRYGELLPKLKPVMIPPFKRSGEFDPAPSEKTIARLCENNGADRINWSALERVNCPDLADYNLFADDEDPRSTPNERGVPYVLNSKLFSDHTVKYRVIFVPPGKQMTYQDKSSHGINATVLFPPGTVIAKTFAHPNEPDNAEKVIETRLLIKRINGKGNAFWRGLPYVWETDDNGKAVAKLAMGGMTTASSWHFHDSDSGVLQVGQTDRYMVPDANTCINCHGNDDRPAGAAPIGPKVRHLNRPYKPETAFMHGEGQAAFPASNQLQYWVDKGLLRGAPELNVDPDTQLARNVEHVPRWNVPGDSGHAADSDKDIEARIRGYLEVNCQHCHNPHGTAKNTGFYLDAFRKVNATYGICKPPTAAGHSGTCGREAVIVPGAADESIIDCRVAHPQDGETFDPARAMPSVARSVAHDEAIALMRDWINKVVDESYENGSDCL